MSLLRRFDESMPASPLRDAMRAIGGLWVPASITIKTREVIAEAADRGVRALNVHEITAELAERLPDLEFLGCDEGSPDLSLIEPLHRLRGLSLDGFAGRLPLESLPHLEWLSFSVCDREGLDALRDGHPTLWNLKAGTYPSADLRLLERVRLRTLRIVNSRRLTSLAGAEALAPSLTSLELSVCPKLASLDGVETLNQLEVLELGSLRRITTIDIVRQLPRLRLLAISELKDVETLAPIANHPALEFLGLSRTRDGDLDPVATLRNLRLIIAPSKGWNRDITAFPYFDNYRPEDEPAREAYRRLMNA